MPANLIVALVLLAVEGLKAYRAKQEQTARANDDPRDGNDRPRG